jgi:hypothetical protein
MSTVAAMSSPAPARDPGPIDVRGRTAVEPRPGSLSPRATPEPRERRRLYEQVEEAVDRGNGRVEDEQTYQLRRLRDDRDARLGRVKPQREVERIDEGQDRRERIEQQAARRQRAGERARGRRAGESPRRPPTAIDQTPTPGGSTMARFVEEQAKLLAAAQARYQRDLAEAEAARDAAVDAAGTREAAALARRRFDERRSRLTRQYQEYRRKILGADSPAP